MKQLKQVSKFNELKKKINFKKTRIIVTVITAGIIGAFSAYFINPISPKPICAQQEQICVENVQKTIYLKQDSNDRITRLDDKHKLAKQEKNTGENTFRVAEAHYYEKEWDKAMVKYCELMQFSRYRKYAIEMAYGCMDSLGDYNLNILKEIIIVVNKDMSSKEKEKIKKSWLYREIAKSYVQMRNSTINNSKNDCLIKKRYPPIQEIYSKYDKQKRDKRIKTTFQEIEPEYY